MLVLGAVTAEAGGIAGETQSLDLWQRLLSWAQSWMPEEAPTVVNVFEEEGSSIDPNGGALGTVGKILSSTPPLDGVVLK
jgi:hypothetical protein